MFGKPNKPSPIDSLIGAGSVIEGNISFSGGLRVDGHVRGNITATGTKPGTLVLSEMAKVEGEIEVAHVVINGTVAGPVRALLERGQLGDLVPLGLVAQLLTTDATFSESERHMAQLALVRLEPMIGKQPPPVLAAWGAATTTVVVDLAADPRQAAHLGRVLTRTDALLNQVEASQLAVHSDLLPRGFRARLGAVAEALSEACVRLSGDRDGAIASSPAIEHAWDRARAHRLGAEDSPEVLAFTAAVRLWRWLLTEEAPADLGLADRAQRHLSVDSWADAAVNDAATGVDDVHLSEALRQVVEASLARRDREERAFAASLAAYTAHDSGSGSEPLSGAGTTAWPLESRREAAK